MASTIYGMNNYYSLFTSPVKNFNVNPVTNLMYVSTANRVYSQTFAKKLNSTVSSYLTSLNTNVNNVKSAAKPFTDKGSESSFNQKSVSSSDSSSVTGTAAPNADNQTYTLNVSKIAQAQTNTGKGMNSTEKSSFLTGLNTFSIKVGNKEEKNISISIDEKDTNKSGLTKMASSINYARLGVTASVETDSKTGMNYLKLVSDKTGTDSTFSIADKSGNAVAASSLDSVSQNAQNAEYTLDGKQYTSQSNTISLNNDKVQLTFNKADSKDIKINIGVDVESIKSDIEDLVENYNDVIDFAASSASQLKGADTLKKEFSAVTSARKASLSGIGLNVSSDGKLSIDKNKLDDAVKNNLWRVKDLLGGSGGIGERIYNLSTNVLSSPLKYSKPNESGRDFNNFYNYMSNANRMPYPQNMYSGMVVDTLL